MRLLIALVASMLFTLPLAAHAAGVSNFELKNLDGDEVSLKGLLEDNKLVIIDFWQVGCKPCNELLPHLQEYYDEYKKQGVVFVIISRDTSLTLPQVEPFFKSNDYSFDVLLDTDLEVSGDFGVKASPASFVIDGDRNLLFQHYGYKPGQEEELKDVIEKFLAGEAVEAVEIEGQD